MSKKLLFTSLLVAAAPLFAQTVSFSISLNHQSYVLDEQVELTFRIKNLGVTPINISDYELFRDNRVEIEIIDQSRQVLKPFREGRIIEALSLEKDEAQAFRVPLCDWFPLGIGHYQVRVKLYNAGLRFDSPIEMFDVVPGFELATASHHVSLRPAIERTLHLVYWARENHEYAFLRAEDNPPRGRIRTMLLGDIMRVKKPSIERKGPDGVFHVFRQVTRDTLSRTEIISDLDGIRVADVKHAVESASSPMIDSLREAVERKANEKR